MPDYHLTERTDEPDAVTLSDSHFGVNVVTIYDQEIADPSEGLADLVKELGAHTLRFPGGSATEHYFDMTNPNSAVSPVAGASPLTPMDGFFSAAADIGADVQLVVPTKVGFRDTAIDALRAGTYGERDALAASYLSDIDTFVRAAFAEAQANGVTITALEIGNEFWGSGEMTGGEYGFLAGRLAVHLETILVDLGLNDAVGIIAQSTAAASDIYAPRNNTALYIETSDGVETLRSQAYVDQTFGGSVPSNYEAVTAPGQGSAAGQLNALIAQINAVPGAADALDGVVLHMYQRQGLSGVDDGRNFIFDQLRNFEDRLDRSAASDPMSYNITEWNVNTRDHDDNAGLRHASMLIETLYELTTHRVTNAQIWPLTFNAAQGTSMVDLGDDRLSIAGEMFSLMEESLPGLDPILDWSVEDAIDIHGFADASRAVLFVSERSGSTQNGVTLHVDGLLESAKYVTTMTHLWDGGAGGDNAAAPPDITQINGRTGPLGTLDFDLLGWANLRVELTQVSYLDDLVRTYDANDRIFSYGGSDEVHASGGNDYIHGGNGDDRIFAGDGYDLLEGGTGQDTLTGGGQRDTFTFTTGDGQDVITDFTFWTDRLRINGEDAFNLAGMSALAGVSFSVSEAGVWLTYGDGDSIKFEDLIPRLSDPGGSKVTGTNGTDVLRGGAGQDDLRGYNGADYLEDGAGRDFLRGGNGKDLFVLVRDGERDVITDFQAAKDRIDLTAWEVAHFADLDISVDYHLNGDWAGYGHIQHGEEVLRLDGMDDAMLAVLDSGNIEI